MPRGLLNSSSSISPGGVGGRSDGILTCAIPVLSLSDSPRSQRPPRRTRPTGSRLLEAQCSRARRLPAPRYSPTSARRRGGGCEIRTREGLPPTRFPSVRPRPLGESSAGKLIDSQLWARQQRCVAAYCRDKQLARRRTGATRCAPLNSGCGLQAGRGWTPLPRPCPHRP
jgi:hypothetical protein